MVTYDVVLTCEACSRQVDGTIVLHLRPAGEEARAVNEAAIAVRLNSMCDPFPVEAFKAPELQLHEPMLVLDDGRTLCDAKCQRLADEEDERQARKAPAAAPPATKAVTITRDTPIPPLKPAQSWAKVTLRGTPKAPPLPDHTPEIKLTAGQQEAYDLVREEAGNPGDFRLIKIVGYAGTGKTTLMKEILAGIGPATLLAPTGKAAARLREVTGGPASTIHSWLYAPEEDTRSGEVKFQRKPSNLLDVTSNRVVVIDEFSMVGEDIWDDLALAAQTLGLTIVAVGDGFQLPPVQDAGSTFEPLKLPAKAEVKLTEVMRQAQDNPIIAASMAIRDGKPFDGLRKLHKFSPADVPDAAFNCWSNGGVTILHRNATRMRINFELRRRRGFDTYLVAQAGEPLLVLKNNAALATFNGEVLQFERWIDEPREARVVHDRYKNKEQPLHFGLAEVSGRRVVLCYEELAGWTEVGHPSMARAIADRWREMVTVRSQMTGEVEERDRPIPLLSANFGYGFTAHKAQGSQWPLALAVIEGSVRLQKEEGLRWLYTAITRAVNQAAYSMGNL